MNLFGLHIHLPVATTAAAIAPAVLPKTTLAVAKLAASDVGRAVAADIRAVASKDLTGDQKRAEVAANTLPLIIAYLASGGVRATVHEVADTANNLVQTIHDDTHSATAGTVAAAILSIPAHG